MKSSEILIQVTEALDDWASDYGGNAEFAGDAGHLFAILSAKPGGVRAAVWLRSEKKRGEYEESGIVDRTLHVIISRARGFRIEKSETHILTTPSGPPLIDLVEEARDVLRGLDFTVDETEFTLDYKGYEPFTFRPDDKPLDAYDLEFSLGCQLPAIVSATRIFAKLSTSYVIAEDDGVALGVVKFASVIYGSGTGYSPSTGLFTAPSTGYYLVEFSVNAASGSDWSIDLLVGDSTVESIDIPTTSHRRISSVIKLAAGDVVTPRASRSGGAMTVLLSPISYLKIHRL